MKSLYTLVLCSAISSSSLAQVITSASMPLLGDSVAIDIISTMVAPGPSGAGQTWDFSTAVGTQTGFFNFVDPATTIFDYRFPNSNLCGISWEGAHAYYDNQAGALNTLGFGTLVGPADTAFSVYTDAETVVELPFQHMDMFSDNFAGQDIALGFPFAFTGNLSVTADGSGTLITPTGTFTNVVRYHLTYSKTNVNVTTTKDQYVWMSADHRFWLMLTETTTTNGIPSELTWWSTNPINISVGIEATPNTESVRIQNSLVENDILTVLGSSEAQVDLFIFDLTGQVVETINRVNLNGRFDIDVDHYTHGVYVIQVASGDMLMSERFIVK